MRSILATLLLCLAGVVVGLHHLGHSDDRRISRQIKHSLASMPEVRPPASAPDDYMEVADRGMRFYHKTARELLRREGNPQRPGVWFYHMDPRREPGGSSGRFSGAKRPFLKSESAGVF
jgi:hypothetical protein